MALIGCILGAVFVKVKGHIPGSSITRKSIVFGFVLFAISFLLSLPSLVNPRVSLLSGTALYVFRLESFAVTIVAYPLLGWLFGYLLQRRLTPKGS